MTNSLLTGLKLPFNPPHQCVIGRPGTGKQLFAVQRALLALSLKKSVVIMEAGGSYRHFAETIGGTVWHFEKNELLRFGPAPVHVFDYEGSAPTLPPWDAALQTAQLPCFKAQNWEAETAIVVDELAWIARQIPALGTHLEGTIQKGAILTAIGQVLTDYELVRKDITPPVQLVQLSLDTLRTRTVPAS